MNYIFFSSFIFFVCREDSLRDKQKTLKHVYTVKAYTVSENQKVYKMFILEAILLGMLCKTGTLYLCMSADWVRTSPNYCCTIPY